MFLLRRYARRPSPSMVVALIALLLASGGVAYAAIPNSTTGAISGCYVTRTGALRVINTQAGETCTTKETPLTWNQPGSTYVRRANTSSGIAIVHCDAGDFATGGGAQATESLDRVIPLTNTDFSTDGQTPNGYFATDSTTLGVVYVWVICVDITPTP